MFVFLSKRFIIPITSKIIGLSLVYLFLDTLLISLSSEFLAVSDLVAR